MSQAEYDMVVFISSSTFGAISVSRHRAPSELPRPQGRFVSSHSEMGRLELQLNSIVGPLPDAGMDCAMPLDRDQQCHRTCIAYVI